ncbi:MAG: phosphoribosylamine--glycine ligase [Bdellovibrio sp. CG10_big_fil_rev_8_21_14_0_10_47_8]|nr:MAG: phosphoribosylamine--glycine ligase [Bdellovibrio sp. CG10_big_fil_rev_8_21_14_0_10_47_8]
MKVLVIGEGGREHALVHALSQSPSVTEVHAIPGSDGMSREAICHALDWRHFDPLLSFCLKTEIDYVFIGPESPLVDGLADRLRDRGILVVGPSKESAQLEGSKIFAKKFMQESGVPTAHFQIVSSVDQTMMAAGEFTPPYVLKADGLAGGKGVFICDTLPELKSAARELFEEKILGEAGLSALLEQFTPGWELSFLILTNGREWSALPIAQDHKRLMEDDKGPNTGGMGTVAPLTISSALRTQIESQVLQPTVDLLAKKNMLYRGVLFIGLMIGKEGPSVLEFNCRFGDPETQTILPLVDGDLGLIFKNLAQGKVTSLGQKNLFASCVVLAAPGYPMKPEKNLPIEGEIHASSEFSYFLHAGTKKDSQDHWLTRGGRVLNAIGLGSSLKESLQNAYSQAGKVRWMGLQKRMDIGVHFKKSSAH